MENLAALTGMGFRMYSVLSILKDRPFDLAFLLYKDSWRGERILT